MASQMDRFYVVMHVGNSCPEIFCPSSAAAEVAAEVAAGLQTDGLSSGLGRSAR